MTVPARARLPTALLLGAVGAMVLGGTVYGAMSREYGATAVGVLISACLLWLAWASSSARIYADGSFVGRTAPWPSRCPTELLDSIRLGGSPDSPQWVFVRTDGEVAFRVSARLYPEQSVRTLAEWLGKEVRLQL